MKTIGICIGATTISIVGLEKKDSRIKSLIKKSIPHHGNSKKGLLEIIKEVDLNNFDRICITGRKFRKNINLTSITEPEAIEYSLQSMLNKKKNYNVLISAGGESILVYELDQNNTIKNVFTGNKCASGTGSFLKQQLGRMDMTLSDLKDHYNESYDISGRCSVFCKSDCTHALNKGVKKDKVVAGLCKMMSMKMTELLSSLKRKDVIMIGGLSKVKPVIDFLKKSVDSIYIPENNDCFEAYGAALWALSNETKSFTGTEYIFNEDNSSFHFLESLKKSKKLVEFKRANHKKPLNGDECILGLDVGSTTTKAVLMRKNDNAILASVYLRTNGDPVKAAKECYKEIKKQIGNIKIKIIGLGTTGSGRYITGIHAQTKSIYNEIICHAAASVFYDKEVDTIFEIGGQDAKYTYITQGVPSDYAMNEACSAGTGSFLEEISKESLNIKVQEIEKIALRSNNPLNFNDQCSAFISSDIATAFQEGLHKDDIVAGLVYSICMNYNNRVKGARPYGKKIFMQGGVCYNKAIPTAMAALLKTRIIVPPDPGLMGAYGCSLEIKKRLEKKLLNKKNFNLKKMINRNIKYCKSFICKGGKEKCDRKCQINILEIEREKIPFGGACNKYYNLINKSNNFSKEYDYVALREKMIFHDFAKASGKAGKKAKKIGINRTFLTNTLFPLYFNFWDQLGFKVVLSDKITAEGREKRKSSFCFPAEISHGAFDDLLTKKPDYIFMPHITHLHVKGSDKNNKVCVFVQGETYYLKESFKDQKLPPILSPVIDFQKHVDTVKDEFIKTAISIGCLKKDARSAFDFARQIQFDYYEKATDIGRKIISDLEKNPDEFAVVLLGRWYNALAKEANMNIPHKFASRGIKIIPFDFIPYQYENLGYHMHWGSGKTILQVARYIKNHPQLFGTYVTNFSCGPDSFLISYFREEMGNKPSLTLELDSHTADVGLNTRIEAAIDIIRYYRQLKINQKYINNDFIPAKTVYRGKNVFFIDSSKKEWNLKDPGVTFLFPNMGKFLSEAGVAALIGERFNAKLVDDPDIEALNLGKANSTCKECLPYIMCVGSLLKYIKTRRKPGEKIAYFIINDFSPCRIEQYQVGFDKLIKKNKLKDVAVLTLSASEGFAGMGIKPLLKVWSAFCLADVLQQIYSVVLTLARDKFESFNIFENEWKKIKSNFMGKEKISLYKRMKLSAERMSKIELKKSLDNAKRVTITGEIYVRNESFCRQHIEKTLANMGFISKIMPLTEWQYYVDYILWKNITRDKLSFFKRLFFLIKRKIQSNIEKKIKKIFAGSGLYEYDPIDIKAILKTSENLVNKNLLGDIGITVGVGLKDSLNESCGIISLSPFACLQTRMAESILNNNMILDKKLMVNKDSVFNDKIYDLDKNMPLPYLAIESDGNPYPQIVEAKLEIFALQANRVGQLMADAKNNKNYISVS